MGLIKVSARNPEESRKPFEPTCSCGDTGSHTPRDPAPDTLSAHAVSGKQARSPVIASVPKSFHSTATAQLAPFGRCVELPYLSPSWLFLARHMNALKGLESKLKVPAEKWV